DNGEAFTPRDYFYYGNELREHGYYKEAIENYTKHINMKDGWTEDNMYACIFRADCWRMLGEMENEMDSLLDAFIFAKDPRPEICCLIGMHLQQKGQFQTALFWYQLAINQTDDPDKWSFTYPAYATWYPHLQCCICYYNLQEFEKAFSHNEKARHYRPQDEHI